jgi:outer membrane protein OmpA-like peptidoglycan-associated protein
VSDHKIDLRVAAVIAVAAFLAACSSRPDPLVQVRARMAAASMDDGMRTHAAGSLAEAQRALAMAADADGDEERNHFVYMTEKNLDIAAAIVARRQAERDLDGLRPGRTATQEPAPQKAPPTAVEKRPIPSAPQPPSGGRDAGAAPAQTPNQAPAQAQPQAPAQTQPAPESTAGLTPKSFGSTTLTIPDLSFDSGTTNLSADSRQRLDGLVGSLRRDTGLRILIAGHTDNIGSSEANLQTSLTRAKAVKAYLLDQGIAPDRIQTLGQGAQYPIASNNTEDGRARNRRVEIALYRVPNGPNGDARRPDTPLPPGN